MSRVEELRQAYELARDAAERARELWAEAAVDEALEEVRAAGVAVGETPVEVFDGFRWKGPMVVTGARVSRDRVTLTFAKLKRDGTVSLQSPGLGSWKGYRAGDIRRLEA